MFTVRIEVEMKSHIIKTDYIGKKDREIYFLQFPGIVVYFCFQQRAYKVNVQCNDKLSI